jgi:hypothetical protein
MIRQTCFFDTIRSTDVKTEVFPRDGELSTEKTQGLGYRLERETTQKMLTLTVG